MSISLKARAHLSTQPNTIAYGRYSEKMFSRSAKRWRSFSATSMYWRKPSDSQRDEADEDDGEADESGAERSAEEPCHSDSRDDHEHTQSRISLPNAIG